MFVSKAERILSRYRPIAPKPPAAAASFATDASASTGASLDSFPRPRKRAAKSRPRASKRLKTAAPLPSAPSCATSSLTHTASDAASHADPSPFFSFGAEFSTCSVAPPPAMQQFGPACFQAFAFAGKDAASGERSAHRALSSKHGFNGGFTEMIRGIARLPSAADVHSLMQVRLPTENAKMPTELGKMFSSAASPQNSCRKLQPQPASSPLCGVDLGSVPVVKSALGCPHPQLLTLPLLPATPSRSHSPSKPRCLPSFASSSSGSTDRGAGMVGFENLRAGLVDGATRFVPGGSSSASDGSSVVDQASLEQVYGGSTDPVLLLSDCNEALWFNKAYARASKSAMERMSRKVVTSGPYIDPLGHPIPLGSFGTSGTLWGFLRKLVVMEPDFLKEECREFCETGLVLDDPSITEQSTDLGLRLGDVCRPSEGKQGVEPAGDSVKESYGSSCRLVAMSVTLESVSGARTDASPLSECVETVEARLEGSMPAFITDSYDRVRWTNSAYKKLMGHSECSSTSQESVFWSASRSPIRGATFVGSGEKIPRSAAAFSGRVNIQLFKAGVRSCMTVPCDVCRLITGSIGEMWVWEFDITAGLSLTCGTLH